MLTISDAAIAYIIKEENSDEAYYNKLCTGFEWPEGASGPTVGIGYDCGYCDREEIQRDWDGLIPQDFIDVLKKASGLTHGAAANFVAHYKRHIKISWAVACQQFIEREVPKWVERTAKALPNCELLPPDCFGALVSVAYNRGPAFQKPGDRTLEMRMIYNLMAQKNFGPIPEVLRKMSRHWPKGSQNYRRRFHEADLFQAGLSSMAALS